MTERAEDAIVAVVAAYIEATKGLTHAERRSVNQAVYTFAGSMVCSDNEHEVKKLSMPGRTVNCCTNPDYPGWPAREGVRA